jgi:hypothetical protein
MHVGSTVFKQDSFSGEYAARDRGLLMISARLTDDGRHFVSLEIAGGLLISARLTYDGGHFVSLEIAGGLLISARLT